MPTSFAPTRAPNDIVIPDCCNIGVIARVLIAVNGAVLAAVLARAAEWQSGLRAFVEASVLVELACLSSLLALCALKKKIRRVAPAWQRAACALAPAAATALIMRFLSTLDAFMIGLDGWALAQGMASAALFGIVLQHYF